MYDLKIIGGLIFDGKGNKPFKANIAILSFPKSVSMQKYTGK